MSEPNLSEKIRLRKTARPSKPRMINATVLNEWADEAAILEAEREKWELEAKRLYGVGQEIEEMREALEAKLSKMGGELRAIEKILAYIRNLKGTTPEIIDEVITATRCVERAIAGG